MESPMSEQQWSNFLVYSFKSFLTEGHLKSEDLIKTMPQALGRESYHGIFDLEPRQTFKEYSGKHRPALGFYRFDFDDNITGGEAARLDVVKFIEWLELRESQYIVFYSGSKGFHIYLPEELLGFSHDERLPEKIKKLLENLSLIFNTIDKGIYNSARKFRAPFSLNQKTKRHKIPVSLDLVKGDLEVIKTLASSLPIFSDFTKGIDRNLKPSEKLLSQSLNKKEKEYEVSEKKQLARHDKIVKFILKTEDASSVEELIQMTLDFDSNSNKKDLKGPYFEDQKYLKGKTPLESCRELVERVVKHKASKAKTNGVDWGVGGKDNLIFEKTESGQPVCNIDNVVRFLAASKRYKDNIWFDDFKKRLFYVKDKKQIEWSDNDDLDLTVLLQRHWKLLVISDSTVSRGVRQYAFMKKRNTMIEALDSLVWDGTPRINNYLSDYLRAENNEYTSCASKNFLISIVARAYLPGCKVDNMLILEGGQGTFKSTANSILVGDENFAEISESISSKDFLLALQGKLLIEIAELDSFSKAEMTRVKQVISCRVDRYRAPYGRATTDNPRSCVFIGTTNDAAYLNDPTGARRFWPIKVGVIDIEAIKRDRRQLFAEAVVAYKSGSTWWEMPIDAAQIEQDNRRVSDVWEELIAEYIIGKYSVTISDVAKFAIRLESVSDLDQQTQKRIAKSLRICGMESKTVRYNGKVSRFWQKNSEKHQESPRKSP